MASGAHKSSPTTVARASIAGLGPNNGALLLEKNRLIARRSTPDSDVVASSDDEIEKHGHEHPPSSHPTPKPVRRSSWLSDVQGAHPVRRSSFASGGGPMSPGTTVPTITPMETWSIPSASTGTRVGASPFTWGNAIWNSESRKEPPARLTEVLPSPTSLGPTNASSPYNEPESAGSPGHRDHASDSTIPFAIPLHPTPKTYRSQSYSVGQLDHDGLPSNVPSPAYFAGRGRSHQTVGLQHRPSRPSMLSELSHEGTSLAGVREVDDDDESTNGSQQGVPLVSSETQIVEQLARENAMLRHASATTQLENMRLRSRAATTNVIPGGYGHSIPGTNHLIQQSVPEEADYAVDEMDEIQSQGFNGTAGSGRRYSEYSVAPENRAYAVPENRKLENLGKSHWQSSLGFGGIEGQQSRRHSFADVPARNVSISSAVGEHPYGADHMAGSLGRGLGGVRTDSIGRPSQAEHHGESDDLQMWQAPDEVHPYKARSRTRKVTAAAYFAASELAARGATMYSPAVSTLPIHPAYLSQGLYGAGRTHSPMSGGPRGLAIGGLLHSRADQVLCVVTFKCCRSEIFYIQEGTGLEVKKGDMVIVEADRGTDLGTVAHTDINWSEAKQLKEALGQEHHKWLMLFSRNSNQAEASSVVYPGLPAHHASSAVGGMGPQGGHRGMHEPSAGEAKPKMIKRLAQNHEIQSLRDKEGNEAKAKRVCQQKVVEHRLHMEVLDAEFQVDWKKLTFYYFADAYINFNSLVTDLFKIYKTRIWMSAINPASFATPSVGLPTPGAIGTGALKFGGDGLDHRKPEDAQLYSMLAHPQRGFSSPFSRAPGTGLDSGVTPIDAVPVGYSGYGTSSYGQPQRQMPSSSPSDYARAMQQHGIVGTEFRAIDFSGLRPDQQRPTELYTSHEGGRSYASGPEGFMQSFQGLSLGPR